MELNVFANCQRFPEYIALKTIGRVQEEKFQSLLQKVSKEQQRKHDQIKDIDGVQKLCVP